MSVSCPLPSSFQSTKWYNLSLLYMCTLHFTTIECSQQWDNMHYTSLHTTVTLHVFVLQCEFRCIVHLLYQPCYQYKCVYICSTCKVILVDAAFSLQCLQQFRVEYSLADLPQSEVDLVGHQTTHIVKFCPLHQTPFETNWLLEVTVAK